MAKKPRPSSATSRVPPPSPPLPPPPASTCNRLDGASRITVPSSSSNVAVSVFEVAISRMPSPDAAGDRLRACE